MQIRYRLWLNTRHTATRHRRSTQRHHPVITRRNSTRHRRVTLWRRLLSKVLVAVQRSALSVVLLAAMRGKVPQLLAGQAVASRARIRLMVARLGNLMKELPRGGDAFELRRDGHGQLRAAAKEGHLRSLPCQLPRLAKGTDAAPSMTGFTR